MWYYMKQGGSVQEKFSSRFVYNKMMMREWKKTKKHPKITFLEDTEQEENTMGILK